MPTTTTTLLLLLLSLLLPPTTSLSSTPTSQKKFYGGAGVGRFTLDDKAGLENGWNCHYDSVLVERLQGKPKTEGGLFLPQDDLPRLHLARVLSVGKGREEENGMITPLPSELRVGSVVICKNPWGIGPKDEETADGKKLSFMRGVDVAAVLDGTIVDSRLDGGE